MIADNLALGAVGNQNGVGGRPSRPPPGPAVQEIECDINCYVLFDVETTGGSRTDDDIIELAAMVLGPDGITLEGGSFSSLIQLNKEVSTVISSLTRISNNMVETAPQFAEVAVDIFEFIDDVMTRKLSTTIGKIILIAHNRRVFDVPFLMHSL